ncbi:MAG: TetR family transcriptional regulator [Crocinitomix sp.]|nr:TetR family transcriptional regulator [Crocinitomix sp.]
MHNLAISIRISDDLFIKDPESTNLGKRIISESIALLDELGFEAFTFKKLGAAIGSPESSVYRYFESKHKLLIYLVCWYWSWIEYKIVFGTINKSSDMERLKTAIEILTKPIKVDNAFIHVNEVLLNKIVVSEATKVFHTKEVDKENDQGYFAVYKRIVQRVSQLIMTINPDYKYPNMLVTTVIEGAHQQVYFADHLPSLTDKKRGKNRVYNFYTEMVCKMIS